MRVLLLCLGVAGPVAADPLVDFARARCIEPVLSGEAFVRDGLEVVTAESIGATPEPIAGQLPTYFQAAPQAPVLATFDLVQRVRACSVWPMESDGRQFQPGDAAALFEGLPVEGYCGAQIAPGVIAVSVDPGPDGLWTFAVLSESAESGRLNVVTFGRETPPDPCEGEE